MALARCAYHSPTDAAAANLLLPQLHHAGLRELLTWFLAPSASPKPLPEFAKRQSMGQVLNGLLRRTLPAATDSIGATSLAVALPWLWAMAARTRYPTVVFDELRPLANYPNVAVPWQPSWSAESVTYVHQQRWNKKKPTRTETWTELRVRTEQPGQQLPSSLLLYSLHAHLKPDGRRYLWSLVGSINFLLSLLPTNPSPLHWHIVRTLYHTNTSYAEEHNLHQQILHALLQPGPTFTEPTTLLLALALLQSDSSGRALALEVLLAAISHGRLVPAALGTHLGQLLAANFAPVPRLTDSLTQSRGLGARTNDALCQILETLLPELPTTPPRQTSKLLATYADLVAHSPRPIPAMVQTQLQAWCASSALKKASALLLK
jgi:hypothetical protein